jgi:hypothetical protein
VPRYGVAIFSNTISSDQKNPKIQKFGVCILWIQYEEKEMRKDEKKKWLEKEGLCDAVP